MSSIRRASIVGLAIIGWFATVAVVPPFVHQVALNVGFSPESATAHGGFALVLSAAVASAALALIVIQVFEVKP
jgi:hypothetical protein